MAFIWTKIVLEFLKQIYGIAHNMNISAKPAVTILCSISYSCFPGGLHFYYAFVLCVNEQTSNNLSSRNKNEENVM